MFWGLIMEPQRRYTQKVKKAFHISMAALDLSTSGNEPAQVMCGFQGRNYLLCTLQKPDLMQCPLDLNFDVGSEVSFAANGECHVHLTGYLQDDIYEEIEEEGDEEETMVAAQKRHKAIENGPPAKKLKKKVQEEEEDDSDMDVNDLLKKELASDEDDSDAEIEDEEVSEEEEETDNVSDEEEEDGASKSSSSEEEVEEEEVTISKKKKKKEQKMNGVAKKSEATPKKIKEEQQQQKTPKEKKSLGKEEKTPNKLEKGQKKVLQGNVIIEELKEGNGPPAKQGKFVNVYYEGKLKSNNKTFDSTTSGPGFKFRLGAGEVIKGWDIGLAGMKVGGKRRIICPPNMAYGPKGSPPAIPPNSTLVFDVELKKVN